MLTGSLSWGLDSPYFFDRFKVVTWVGVRVGCQTYFRRFVPKEKVDSPPEICWNYEQVEHISNFDCVHTPLL